MNVKRNMLREQEVNGEQDAAENYHTKDTNSNKHRAGQTNKTSSNLHAPSNNDRLKKGSMVSVDDLGSNGNKESAEDINLDNKNVVLNFGTQDT